MSFIQRDLWYVDLSKSMDFLLFNFHDKTGYLPDDVDFEFGANGFVENVHNIFPGNLNMQIPLYLDIKSDWQLRLSGYYDGDGANAYRVKLFSPSDWRSELTVFDGIYYYEPSERADISVVICPRWDSGSIRLPRKTSWIERIFEEERVRRGSVLDRQA